MDLPLASPEELVERLAAAYERDPHGVLATDADGTLWDGDVGIDLFEGAIRKRAFRDAALPALRDLAASHGLDVADDATEQAEILYAAYRAERLADGETFEMMAWAFAGWRAIDFDALVREVLDEAKLDTRIVAEVRPIFAWAARRNVPIYVVSASPRGVVVAGVERLGIDPSRVLAMTPKMVGDVIAPALVPPSTYAEGKVHALERAVPDRPLLAAFGDNSFDAEMLRRASVPVAVRPKPALRARAVEVRGLVELRRAGDHSTSLQQRNPAS